jgi:hypothetical protein
MPDYKNGKIYTIRCRYDTSLIYVGSTCNTLSRRIANHKHKSKILPEIMFYQHVQDWDDWYIELYEDFPCERKEHLEKREGEVIRQIGNLNHVINGRTRAEYVEENKESIKSYMKSYRETNKEILAQKKKEYTESKSEYFKDYINQYYKSNNEQIRAQKKEEIICECGCKTNRGHIARHIKTLKHITLMAEKQKSA